MSRVGEADTAYGGRDAEFLVSGEVNWTDPAQNDEGVAYGREFWAAMEKHSTGGLYLNFAGSRRGEGGPGPGGVRRANYERLAAAEGHVRPGRTCSA